MAYKIQAYTLGCKVSQYESEAILEEAERRGFEIAKENEAAEAVVEEEPVKKIPEVKVEEPVRTAPKSYEDIYGEITFIKSKRRS